MRNENQMQALQAGTLAKVMRLLDGLNRSPSNDATVGHVGELLEQYEASRTEIEQSLCWLIGMLLDAFTTHLDQNTSLFSQIKLLQASLSPPLSSTELRTLKSIVENCADQITQLDSVQAETVSEVLAPILKAMPSPGSTVADVTPPKARAREAIVPESAASEFPQASPAARDEDTALSSIVHSAVLIPGRSVPWTDSVTQTDGLAMNREQIKDVIEQSEEFGVLLEVKLAALKKIHSPDQFEAERNSVIRELEKIQKNYRRMTDQFCQVANCLSNSQVDSHQLSAELRRMTVLSFTDELTALPNRRAFRQRLQDEVSRVQRYGQELSLAIIDLDSFKPINDTYGHPAGDAVLRAFAQRVLNRLRQHDLVARYGGEEFAILFPNTDLQGALLALQKVQTVSAKESLDYDGNKLELPTFSAGLANYHQGEGMDGLIRRADDALYRAKHGGRNRIEVSVVGELSTADSSS